MKKRTRLDDDVIKEIKNNNTIIMGQHDVLNCIEVELHIQVSPKLQLVDLYDMILNTFACEDLMIEYA